MRAGPPRFSCPVASPGIAPAARQPGPCGRPAHSSGPIHLHVERNHEHSLTELAAIGCRSPSGGVPPADIDPLESRLNLSVALPAIADGYAVDSELRRRLRYRGHQRFQDPAQQFDRSRPRSVRPVGTRPDQADRLRRARRERRTRPVGSVRLAGTTSRSLASRTRPSPSVTHLRARSTFLGSFSGITSVGEYSTSFFDPNYLTSFWPAEKPVWSSAPAHLRGRASGSPAPRTLSVSGPP